ncbi:MAG: rod shape-determining protein MreC, partial [Raoultibacter sp.]
LYLEDMAANASVTEGDVVITSGLGGSYFRGLIIGTVTKVERNSSGAAVRAVVAPNSSISALQEVLVVLGMDTEGAASSTFSMGTSNTPAQGTDGAAAQGTDGATTNGGSDANAASADSQKEGE